MSSCQRHAIGFVSASIEGRVGVDMFDPDVEVQRQKYAFKCHRSVKNGTDVVYPIHQLSFHKTTKMLATAGGDGLVSIWNIKTRKCVRHWPRYPGPITAFAFDQHGTKAAVAVSHMEKTDKYNSLFFHLVECISERRITGMKRRPFISSR